MSATCEQRIDCCPPTPFDYLIHEPVFLNSRQCATVSCPGNFDTCNVGCILDEIGNPILDENGVPILLEGATPPKSICFCVPAGAISDDTQQGADAQAAALALQEAQAALDAQNICGFTNAYWCCVITCPDTVVFSHDTPCAAGLNQSAAFVQAGVFAADTQDGADQLAKNAAQAAAQAGLTCLFYSAETWASVDCPDGTNCVTSTSPITPTGSTSVGHVPANQYSSIVDQDAANALAAAAACQLALAGVSSQCTIPGTLSGLLWKIPCLCAAGNTPPCEDHSNPCSDNITCRCRDDVPRVGQNTSIPNQQFPGYVDDVTTQITGTPDRIYTVVLRIRGAIELKDYSDFSTNGPGGSPNEGNIVPGTNKFCRTIPDMPGHTYERANIYALIISDPPMTYWLNNLNELAPIFNNQQGTRVVDYNITVQMRASCFVTLRALTVRETSPQSREYSSVVYNTIVPVGGGDPPLNPQVLPQPYCGQFLQMDVISVS